MPTYFPQINSAGIITQRPYSAGNSYATTVVEQPCGVRYVWGWRGTGLTGFSADPLGKFELNYSAITDAEVQVLQDFFTSMRGRYGEFSYLDPGGNLVPKSEDFADATKWERASISSFTTGQADPFNGTRATLISPSASNGMLDTVVLPDGGASGFALTASVWAKASGEGQQLSIGFIDSAFSVLSNTIWTLPAGAWVRIQDTITLATDSYIRVLVGGFGTWNAGQGITLFGAQCVPMPGAGGYLRTPGTPGLHAKCRFDTDQFTPTYNGPNQNSLKLSIVEYK